MAASVAGTSGKRGRHERQQVLDLVRHALHYNKDQLKAPQVLLLDQVAISRQEDVVLCFDQAQ